MSRRRAIVLIALHVVIVAHVIQWLITGRTVSPIEPSEAMYTLNDGHLNAGFIFFSLAILATLVLGRFVCGWGCHVVAYQDLCAWLLKKIGIHPKPFRSRLLVLAPLALALYMFVWPTIYRWLVGGGAPTWSNHLTTTDFWKTFPGPAVAIGTIVVCGFVIIYFLGAKGFCTYACPYGGFFGLADKVAVGRIRVTDDCEHCGHCTSVCSSNVRVHEEVALYGMVVDPGCMKCMDCVSVCPNDALYFGFGAPSLGAKPAAAPKPSRFDFSLTEEIVMVLAGLACLLAFRGLYERIPLLLAMGLGVISAFLFLKLWRLTRDANVRLQQWQLKRGRTLTRAGAVFAAGALVWLALTVHSAAVQAHTWRGRSLLRAVNPGDEIWAPGNRWWEEATAEQRAAATSALTALDRADRWGFLTTPSVLADSIRLQLAVGDVEAAEQSARRLAAAAPDRAESYRGLANVMRKQRRVHEAEAAYREALRRDPNAVTVRLELVSLLVEAGEPSDVLSAYEDLTLLAEDSRVAQYLISQARYTDARTLLEWIIDRFPEEAGSRVLLGTVLIALGDESAGVYQFHRALESAPRMAEAHYNLGLAALRERRVTEALSYLETAAREAPGVSLYHYNLAVATFMSGRPAAALPHLETAIRLNPSDPDCFGFKSVVLRELHDLEGARAAEAEARRLRSN